MPNYNLYGHQHHRVPFKNKEAYCGVKPLPEWEQRVEHRTRAELMAARRAEKIPDMSYDIDGDGVVDQRDYFLGKLFDADHADRLTPGQRKKAVEALNSGYIDRFYFGYDKSGAKRQFPLQQKRGKILNVDSWDELGETYPPAKNAHIVPKHNTRTELSLDRMAERKNSALKLKVKWDERHPQNVPEQPVYQDNWVEKPIITHMAQRANADNQAARVRAGLYPEPSWVNPERECLHPGLEWVQDPVFQTRGQLQETRKELMKRDLDERRMHGDATYIPLDVLAAKKAEACYNYRRGHAANMTKTRLEDYRKKERIEYDMAHFGQRDRELPRYADQAHPWWTLKQMNRHMSEPSMVANSKPEQTVLKITQTRPDPKPEPKPAREPRGELVVAQMPTLERQEVGRKTVKRWTTDIIEHNQHRNVPRLFDTLRASRTLAKDFAPLENFSSFEWTRNQSLRQQAEARKRNAETVPRSKLDPSTFPAEERGFGGAVSSVSYDTHGSRGNRSRVRSASGTSERGMTRSRATTIDPSMPERIASWGRAPAASTLDFTDAPRAPTIHRSASVPSLGGTVRVRTGGFSRVESSEQRG